MSKTAEKKARVPKLRFPEFRQAAPWRDTPLRLAAETITNGSANSEDHIPGGIYPMFDRSTVVKASNRFLFDGQAIILPGEGATFPPKRYTGKFDLHQRAYALMDFTADSAFIFYAIDKTKDVLANNAVSSTVRSLRLPIIANHLVPITTLAEQRKIGECLQSLDDLITAETEKLETLKRHKLGLLQQLFPAEGIATPSFRFAEFHNSGDWKEMSLSDLGTLIQGLTYSPGDVRDHGLLVLRSSNIKNGTIALADRVYVDPYVNGASLSKPDDILICVRNGSIALIGKNALIPMGLPLCTHGAFMSVFRSPSARFVFQLFQTLTYQKQVAADLGATINSINGSQFLKYKFLVPEKPEQRKISDFLSSVDERIITIAENLELLKKQKSGLMQQLFPSWDETEQ